MELHSEVARSRSGRDEAGSWFRERDVRGGTRKQGRGRKERRGAHLLVRSAGDEADEVAVGVVELVREKRNSGAKAEDGRLVPWRLAVAWARMVVGCCDLGGAEKQGGGRRGFGSGGDGEWRQPVGWERDREGSRGRR